MPSLAVTTTVKASAVRRKRIVDAALRLFSATPYDAVQMDDVAHAAGVAKPTLYRYFATKETLFVEGMDVILGELADEAWALVETAENGTDALQKVVRIVLDNLGACTAAIRALDGSDTGLGDRGRAVIRSRVKRIREVMSAVIGKGVASGEFRDFDTDLAAWAMLGAVRMIAANASRRNHAQVARTLTDLMLRGLSVAPEQAQAAPVRNGAHSRDILQTRKTGTTP